MINKYLYYWQLPLYLHQSLGSKSYSIYWINAVTAVVSIWTWLSNFIQVQTKFQHVLSERLRLSA